MPTAERPAMTAERIMELRALCNAATAGPWERSSTHVYHFGKDDGANVCSFSSPHALDKYGGTSVGYREIAIGDKGLHQACDNADFVIAARTALPDALDEIAALRDALRKAGEASGYLITLYRLLQAGKSVRDLAEAECAYAASTARLRALLPEPASKGERT